MVSNRTTPSQWKYRWILFGHEDLDIPSVWDLWLKTLDDAIEAANQYGVEKSDWIQSEG